MKYCILALLLASSVHTKNLVQVKVSDEDDGGYIVIEQEINESDPNTSFKMIQDDGLEYTYRGENKNGDSPLPGMCPAGKFCKDGQVLSEAPGDQDQCDCSKLIDDGDKCDSPCAQECGCASTRYGGNASKLFQTRRLQWKMKKDMERLLAQSRTPADEDAKKLESLTGMLKGMKEAKAQGKDPTSVIPNGEQKQEQPAQSQQQPAEQKQQQSGEQGQMDKKAPAVDIEKLSGTTTGTASGDAEKMKQLESTLKVLKEQKGSSNQQQNQNQGQNQQMNGNGDQMNGMNMNMNNGSNNGMNNGMNMDNGNNMSNQNQDGNNYEPHHHHHHHSDSNANIRRGRNGKIREIIVDVYDDEDEQSHSHAQKKSHHRSEHKHHNRSHHRHH